MGIYDELGLVPVINAAGTLTILGGSIMPPEVTDAMAEASRHFVDLNELHLAAGRRIAELVGAEAACVCAGAASGIAQMAAACMAGADNASIRRLPDAEGMPDLFIVHTAHRNQFDQAIRQAGGTIVEIDSDDARPLDEQLLEALARERVAAVSYTHAWFCLAPALPLSQVAGMAHASGVPVILDAAAEVPPLSNLTRFLDEGADMVVFSGGKAMRGPQSAGIILGRADLIEAARLNGNPNMGIGRPMKVGKEEIAGLVRAVELYAAKDHEAEMMVWEGRVAHVVDALSGIEGLHVWSQMPFGLGQKIPHAALRWDEAVLGVSPAEVVAQLKSGSPRIAVQLLAPDGAHALVVDAPEVRVHPHTLQAGEEAVVARRIRELLARE
jgi:uncharacterized pyridoxal phosphate-dependent enzyme